MRPVSAKPGLQLLEDPRIQDLVAQADDPRASGGDLSRWARILQAAAHAFGFQYMSAHHYGLVIVSVITDLKRLHPRTMDGSLRLSLFARKWHMLFLSCSTRRNRGAIQPSTVAFAQAGIRLNP